MTLSPLYELLVELEDKGTIYIKDNRPWSSGTFRGTIGKMESMGLIEKKVSENGKSFTLSPKGYNYLNKILDVIHTGISHWDGKWRFVVFTISEKKRPLRDRFRRYLESAGLKPYLSSVWISPNDCENEIKKTANKLGVENLLIISCVQPEISNELIKAWDFEKHKKMYEEFINDAELVIKTKNKLEAKKLILSYAFVLNLQPNLPIELMPKDWPSLRATMQYKKLRRVIE